MSESDRQERFDEIKSRIREAAARAGRSEDTVNLIAVSKTFPDTAILEVARLGQVAFGENKVQELVGKMDRLGNGIDNSSIEWHLIGHLQRNKAREIVGRVTLFHALDSVRLGNELQKRLEAVDDSLDCLVQVNVSGEDSKYGVAPGHLDALMDELSTLDRLRLRGLMTLASPASDPEEVRPELARLREISFSIADRCVGGSALLSMGMSGDFEVAIEEGATHVRIGSALFGAR